VNLTLIAAAVSAAIAFGAAWQVQDWRHDAAERDRLEQQAKELARRTDRVDIAATAHEADKERIHVQFRTITKEVDRVVEKESYRAVCVDADGLRLLERALANSPAASGSAPAVPRPAASR
jgi:hypothetical protein